MAKNVLKIDRFEGGINTGSDKRDIADNEIASATDATIHHVGRIKPIGKSSFYDTSSGANGSIEPGYGLKVFQSDFTAESASTASWSVTTDSQAIDAVSAVGTLGIVYCNDEEQQLSPSAFSFYVHVDGVNETGTISVLEGETEAETVQKILDGNALNKVNYTASAGDGSIVVFTADVAGTAHNGELVLAYVTAGDTTPVYSWDLGTTAGGSDAVAHEMTFAITGYENATWNLVMYEPDGTAHTAQYAASGVTAADIIDDLIADITPISGYTITDNGSSLTISANNAGTTYEFNISAWVSNLACTRTGEEYVIVCDENTSALHAYATSSNIWISNIADLGAGTNTKPAFMAPEGILRISDGNYSNESQVDKWWGYIDFTTFDSTNGAIYNQWSGQPREIAAPTYSQADVANTVAAGDSTAITDVAPEAGRLVASIVQQSNGNVGTWDSGRYRFYISYVYDGKQESALAGIGESTNYEYITAGYSLSIAVYVNPPMSNLRITGANIYYRMYDTSDNLLDTNFYLLAEIDFNRTRGVRYSGQEDWQVWSDAGGGISKAGSTTYTADNPLHTENYVTYQSRNGREPDEQIYCRFVSADIANRRSYIAGPNYGGTIYGDRIIESPVDEYDVHPENSYIDAAINDGESIVAISIFANKLLEFKQNTVYVIDIGSAQYTLLGKYSFKGVKIPGAICKTDYGIAWINDFGCFLFTGEAQLEQSAILNLHEKEGRKLIDPSTWAAFITDYSTVGYNPLDKQLMVKRTTESSGTSGDYYMFDFTTWSWVFGTDRLGTSVVCTNFDNLSDGKMIFGVEGSRSGINDDATGNEAGGGETT